MLGETYIKNSIEIGLRYLKRIGDQLEVSNILKQKEIDTNQSKSEEKYVPRD